MCIRDRAFGVSSHYDSAIFNYFDGEEGSAFRCSANSQKTLRYGENPHQKGYFYGNLDAMFDQIHGCLLYTSFRTHVQKMYQLAGFDEATAKKGMEVVMDVETRLAKAFRSRTELRDPHANYNKMSMEELKKNYPTFDWDAYLSAMDLKDVKEIIVGQPASLKACLLYTSHPARQS